MVVYFLGVALIPLTLTVGVVELVLILSYILTLASGTGAAQRAGQLFFSGLSGLAMWGLVVVAGLLIPLIVETLELTRRHLPDMLTRLVPVLTLIGGISLRFVVVYTGLHSFI
jgi:formate-dependent nitrite reductase membrane component NrfD